jgi:hypothetical protein
LGLSSCGFTLGLLKIKLTFFSVEHIDAMAVSGLTHEQQLQQQQQQEIMNANAASGITTMDQAQMQSLGMPPSNGGAMYY